MLNINKEKLDNFGNGIVEYNVETNLRKKYEHLLEEDYQVSGPIIKPIYKRDITKIAAVLLVLVVSIFLIRNESAVPITSGLAQQYLNETQIFGNSDINRKGPSKISELRNSANDAFVKHDYITSIANYEALSFMEDLSVLDQYYLGLNHLKIGNNAEAIKILYEINQNKNSYSQEIDWFISLAYLLSDRQSEAKSVLTKIVNAKAYKTNEAIKLLDSMPKGS